MRTSHATWSPVAASIVIAAALMSSPTAARAEAPTCFGKKATIVGTDNPDTIQGTPDDDVIVAGDGADTVYGEGGDDLICSGAGGSISEESSAVDRIFGGPGDDRLDGGPHDIVPDEDYLVGGPGNDVLYGGADRDTLDDGPGRDHAYGGTGADTFVAGAGNDVLVGGPDSETGGNQVSYEASPAGVVIDLRADTATGYGHDIVKHIWGAAGSRFDDVIKGTPRTDSLAGSCGNDRLVGRGGDDHLDGTLIYHPETCDPATTTDDDLLLGGSGDDEFDGEPGKHIGTDVIHGGPGEDVFNTSGGRERVFGGTGRDLFYAFLRAHALHMDLAEGTYRIGHRSGRVGNVEDVIGTLGDDVIHGNSAANVLVGWGGEDRLYGRGGDDDLRGDGRHEQDPDLTDKTVGGAGSDYCRAEVKRSCER